MLVKNKTQIYSAPAVKGLNNIILLVFCRITHSTLHGIQKLYFVIVINIILYTHIQQSNSFQKCIMPPQIIPYFIFSTLISRGFANRLLS